MDLALAVPVAEVRGAEAGLALVDRLTLTDYPYLQARRGELLRRLGRMQEARDAYRRALALVHDNAERRLLERRLAEARETHPAPHGRPLQAQPEEKPAAAAEQQH